MCIIPCLIPTATKLKTNKQTTTPQHPTGSHYAVPAILELTM